LVAPLALAAGAAACSDTNVPYFTAPTSVPNSPAGIQNAVSGLFAATRNNIGTYVITFAAGYARDGAVFTNTEPRTVEYPLGVLPTPTTAGNLWTLEYQNILQAHQLLATLPTITPPFSAKQNEALIGIVETIEAYNYMIVAEAHDTLGMAIQAVTPGASPPRAVCSPDGWRYIVALLDTANDSLNTAGATAPPVVLPAGFQGVGVAAGPSSSPGTFGSFNRALAAKANLELAYAIARHSAATAPTPTTPGSPDAAALSAAAAALAASGMYNPAQLGPTPAGGWTSGTYVVTHDFSAQSGDVVSPVNSNIGQLAVLNDFLADVDTAHDLRFKAKFVINKVPVQQQTYNPVALQTHLDPATGRDTTYSYNINMYPSPGSPLPIVREEQLVLWNAQIMIGQGNFAGALALINQVRTIVGGPALAPYPGSDASSYVTVRNDLMREQRISTAWEASGDRTISIRMYGLAAVADTTWMHEDPSVKTGDQHTTVNPIPFTELTGRNGTFATTCSL